MCTHVTKHCAMAHAEPSSGVNKGMVLMSNDEAQSLVDRGDTIVHEISEGRKVKADDPEMVLAQLSLLRETYIDAVATLGWEHFTDEELRAVAIRGNSLLTASVKKTPNTSCMVTHRAFHDGYMKQLASQILFTMDTMAMADESERAQAQSEYIAKRGLSFRSRDSDKYINSDSFDVCTDPARLAEVFAVYDKNKAEGVGFPCDMSAPAAWCEGGKVAANKPTKGKARRRRARR